MNVTLTVLLFGSWILIFIGVFLYERLEQKAAALTVQVDRLVRNQRSMMEHLGVSTSEDPLDAEIRQLVQNGQVYEAITAYRARTGASYKVAKRYVDSLIE